MIHQTSRDRFHPGLLPLRRLHRYRKRQPSSIISRLRGLIQGYVIHFIKDIIRHDLGLVVLQPPLHEAEVTVRHRVVLRQRVVRIQTAQLTQQLIEVTRGFTLLGRQIEREARRVQLQALHHHLRHVRTAYIATTPKPPPPGPAHTAHQAARVNRTRVCVFMRCACACPSWARELERRRLGLRFGLGRRQDPNLNPNPHPDATALVI